MNSRALYINFKPIIFKLLEGLEQKGFYYHNLDHTLDNLNRSIYLAQKENLNIKDLELLKLSSLFHDIGYIIDPKDHEQKGNQIFELCIKNKKKELKKLNIFNSYQLNKIEKIFKKNININTNEINKVKENILATRSNHKPKTLSQKIIRDADIDNLGRKDFLKKNKLIKKELETLNNKKISKRQRLKTSLKLIKKTNFYTKTQNKERNKQLNKNILKIKKKLKIK